MVISVPIYYRYIIKFLSEVAVFAEAEDFGNNMKLCVFKQWYLAQVCFGMK